MTKQHYEAIAQIIRQNKPAPNEHGHYIITHIAEELADFFRRDNNRFNETKFLVACGTHKED